jgi:hypothetical protein
MLVAPIVVLAHPLTRREVLGDQCYGQLPRRASVHVTALDARTGRPLSKELQWRSALIVRDGMYVDSSTVAYGAARERAGTYNVVVRAPGYREWRRDDLRVPQRLCDLKRARLQAGLQPVADE